MYIKCQKCGGPAQGIFTPCKDCQTKTEKTTEVGKSGSAVGYVKLPSSLTAENGAKGLLSGEFFETVHVTCSECCGRGCDDCGEIGHGGMKVPVSWTTIKEIYDRVVKNYT